MGDIAKINVSRIDRSLTNKVPLYFARKFCLLPVHSAGSHIVVIMANGQDDPLLLGKLSDQLNARLVPYTLKSYPEKDVRKAIDRLYEGKKLRFGELLLINNIINEAQLSEVIQIQKDSPSKKIGSIVKELGYAGESQLQKVFAEQIGYKFLDLDAANFLDLTLITKFPEDIITKYRILPLPNSDDYKKLLLLSAKEIDATIVERIKKEMKVDTIEPIMTVEKELESAIESTFRRLAAIKSREKSLGKMLLEKGLLTQEQLDKALTDQRQNNMKLGEVLITRRILPERVVMEVIAEKIDSIFMKELPAIIDPGLKSKMTQRFATFNKVVPIGFDKGKLTVAMTDPADKNLLSTLKAAINMEINPVLASEAQIRIAIKKLYFDQVKNEDKHVSARLALKEIDLHIEEPDAQYNTERIINTVNNILVEAVLQGASDIHLSPDEKGLSLSYRVDGSLKRVASFPSKDRDNITARIKIMSDMRIDTKHIPQGGRIVASIEDRHIDFRVSTLPTQYGENSVLRILDSSKMLGSDLAKLGMPEQMADDFLEQCERAQGIILVTGPTGSGKTTSLYHVLNYLHKDFPHKSISTIENPIEYVIDGIVQSEINEARGLTYAKILKEKLRQDPDIIMVGEIRNLEEADLAFTAALTGHTVLSTLHTNDGASTVRRLVEIGLEPYNVSTGINCVLSQRLAKRICERCVTDYVPNDREIRRIRKSIPDFDPVGKNFKKGWGCDFCNDGYKGRVGIYELLHIDADVKALISQNATDSQIRAAAVRKGMKTLRMAGLEYAMQGITTIQEVLSVTDIMH